MRKTTLILAALAFALFTATPAQASLILAIDFGANSGTTGWDVVIIDDSIVGTVSSGGVWTATDVDGEAATPGDIRFSGMVGAFMISVEIGLSKPLVGPRRLDLFSLSVSSAGAGGTLSVLLIDTDYLAPLHAGPYGVRTEIGGTTDGTVFTRTGVSPANSESFFSGLFNVNTFGPGAFSGDTSGSIAMAPGSLFSILSLIHITHFAAPGAQFGAITSFDQLVTVPEPASALLLALGFVGVVAARRRRRRSA